LEIAGELKGSKAGVQETFVRHEGLAPVRLIWLETGSGSMESGRISRTVSTIGLPFPRVLGVMVEDDKVRLFAR
jgi:hypothetical protein